MPEAGQLTVIGLVGLLFLSILAGLALVGGLTVSSIAADTTNADSGSGRTLVVDDDSVLLEGSADCPDAGYVTIQNAVNTAEPGDTVEVCGGTYSESVTVETDDVSIRANGSVEVEPGVPAAFDIAADDVTVDGFTVTKAEGLGIQVTGDRAVIENNHVHSTKKHENTAMDTGIRLRITNETVVRNNTVVGFPDHGISVAEADEPDTWTNDATDNRIVDNHVTGETDTEFVNSGIYVGSRAGGTEVLNNTITDIYWNPAGQYSSYTGEGGRPQYGIGIWVNGTQTEVRGNTMRRSFWGITSDMLAFSMVNNTMTNITFHGGQLSGDEHEAIVRNNTLDGALTGGFQGILNGGSIVMVGNTVRNVECGAGYAGGGCGTGLDVTINDANSTARFLDNRVENNTIGIRIFESQSEFEDHDRLDNVEIHGNVIVQNDVLGISNSNRDSTDGYWPIVDARNNIWGCGGPSGDLEDPITGRPANGTGDGLSAGDDPGVSNVHFDPYQVQNPSSCTESQPPPTDTPTPTPTDTPTPTPTDTPTATPTDTPTATPSSTAGDGDSNGTESGDGGGDDTAPPSGEGTGSSEGATVTPPPSPTATPSATPTPTPVVEPGFGALTWVVGVVALLGLLAIRRRRTVGGIDGRD